MMDCTMLLIKSMGCSGIYQMGMAVNSERPPHFPDEPSHSSRTCGGRDSTAWPHQHPCYHERYRRKGRH